MEIGGLRRELGGALEVGNGRGAVAEVLIGESEGVVGGGELGGEREDLAVKRIRLLEVAGLVVGEGLAIERFDGVGHGKTDLPRRHEDTKGRQGIKRRDAKRKSTSLRFTSLHFGVPTCLRAFV